MKALNANKRNNKYTPVPIAQEKCKKRVYYCLIFLFSGSHWALLVFLRETPAKRKEDWVSLTVIFAAILLSMCIESRDYHFQRETFIIYTLVALGIAVIPAIWLPWLLLLLPAEGAMSGVWLKVFNRKRNRRKI